MTPRLWIRDAVAKPTGVMHRKPISVRYLAAAKYEVNITFVTSGIMIHTMAA
jgi:hypothetical protein